jgi:4a-hydroxytetrahydrobiopterin dehydratase
VAFPLPAARGSAAAAEAESGAPVGRAEESFSSPTRWGELAFDAHPRRAAILRVGGRRMQMSQLASKQCVPCKGGVPPLEGARLRALHDELGGGWKLVEDHHLEKGYRFANFREALDFTNQVGELAEEQGHHPEIELGWGRVKLLVWTHKIDGLTESDFIWAAKADRLRSEETPGSNAPSRT